MAYDDKIGGKTKKKKDWLAYSDSKTVTPTNTEIIMGAYGDLAADTPTNAPITRRGTPPGLTKQRLNGDIGYGSSDVGGTETVGAGDVGGTETAGTDAVVNAYDGAISIAGQIKADELLAAESNRDKAIQSAQNAYSQMMTTSAQNQEQLARMGLTNSGYSDYINASAQAVKRGEISQAQADYATSVKDIERAYNDAIATADSTRNTSYLKTIMGLESGEISPSVASEIAKAQGYTEEQMVKVNDMISGAQKKLVSDYQASIDAGTGVSTSEIIADIQLGNLTTEQGANVIVDNFKKAISASTDETTFLSVRSDFDKAYSTGIVGQKTYQDTYGLYVKDLYDEANAYTGNASGKYKYMESVKREIAELYNAGKIDENTYNTYYDQLTTDMKNTGWLVDSNISYEDGSGVVSVDGKRYTYAAKGTKVTDKDLIKKLNDEYKLSGLIEYANYNGKSYEVSGAHYMDIGDSHRDDEIGNKLDEISTGDVNKSPKDGTVVSYGGKMYVRENNFWRSLTAVKDDYNTLR